MDLDKLDITKVFEKMYNTKNNEELKKELINMITDVSELIEAIEALVSAHFITLMLMSEEEIEKVFKSVYGERKEIKEDDKAENDLIEVIEYLKNRITKEKKKWDYKEDSVK